MKIHIKFSLGFIILLWGISLKSQVTIADGLPGCLPVVNQEGVACTVGGVGTTFFGLNAMNQFVVQNVDGINCCDPSPGGDGGAYFEFGLLDISNYSNVTINLGYSASNTAYEDDSPGAPLFGCTGTNPPDNSHDQIIFTYSIDGGPEVQSLYAHGTSDSDFTGTWNAGPLNGSTLTIKIYASNKASAEIFYFQNLLVTGTLILSAGPDKSGCVGDPVDLDGVGTGNWTGGLGVFGDPTMAMTDYTPDASELNSTVTLTFTGAPAYTGCPAPSDQMNIVVNPLQDPSFSISDFCAPTSMAPTGIITPGGSFSFDPPPGDGAVINASTGIITNAVGGASYSVKYTTPGPCPDESIITVNAEEGPSGTLSGSATLCPGECATFSFNFTSGSEPYTINLTANPPGFALPPIPGVAVNTDFTICYMGSGPLPTIDMSTFTITIPTIFTGSGSLTLTGISDGSGCPGTASGSFNLTLTAGPTALPAGPLTACADQNGDGTFDLTTLENTVNGGNGALTVNWYEDAAGTIPISNPSAYISAGGTVYATVTSGNCESNTIAITLVVETGNVPFISMVCAQSGIDMCSLCLTGGFTDLEFAFGDGNSYTVTVRDNSTNIDYTGVVSNTVLLNVPVAGSTTFELLSIQPVVGCPNFDSYGDLVTVNIVLAPDIDPVSIPASCQPITLPPITGSNLSGNQVYSTGPGGTGTIYNPGDMIFGNQTLYIYDENAGCLDEETVVITINPLVTVDEIADISACESAVLPAITGTGLSTSTSYNTNPLGTGTVYAPGDIVTQSITLYVFDPNADPNCLANSVDLVIDIHPKPSVPTLSSITCTGSLGSFTITNPLGSEFQYKLDAMTAQTSNMFSNIPNGSHTITVINTLTNCETSYQFTINCDCATPALLTVPQTSGSVCLGDSFKVNNITFGGSTNIVNVTTNGAGSFSVTSFTTSPFSITYVPNLSDAGKTIDIVLTTNDPDGNGPCAPEFSTISLAVRANPMGIISGSQTVCKGSDITLTASGGTTYFWSANGGTSNTATFTNITAPTTFLVTVTDALGCKDTVAHTVNVGQIWAGRDTIVGYCKTVTTQVNLNNFISIGATSGGIWKNGIDTIFNNTNYTITDLPNGFSTLRYIIDDPVCGKDTALIRVEIRNSNNAGNNGQFKFCESLTTTLDFASAIGSHDAGGTWKVGTSGLNLNLSDPTKVNVSALIQGSYIIYHIIPSNGCLADTATIGLDVIPFKSAGTDVNTDLCLGSSINLTNLVTATDKTGTIYNPNNHGGLTGTSWNTTGLIAGNYTFYYVLTNQSPCLPDTARLVVNLQQSLNPGGDQVSSFCEGQTLILSDYLGSGAAMGGSFYYQNQLVPNGIFTPTGNATDFVFTYEVGDGVLCPKVKAIITLKKILKPSISLTGLDRICDGDCETLTISPTGIPLTSIYLSAASGNSSFTQILGPSNGINPLTYDFCSSQNGPFSFKTWQPGKTVTVKIDSIAFSGNGCTFTYNENITFETKALPTKNISPTICKSDDFMLGGAIFNAGTPAGIVRISSTNGISCDTVASVSLKFYPDAIGSYTETFCDQTKTVTIGTETFSFAKPTGSTTLLGASVNGCDSIVMVNLKYEKVVIPGTYTVETCNDAYSLTLGNMTFNKSNPSGPVLLSGAAAQGCDSLVNVQINFKEFTIAESIIYNCDGSNPTLNLNLASHPGPYQVSLDGVSLGQISNLPYTIPIVAGNHVVIVQNQEGCTDSFNVDVEDNNGPNVVLSQVPNADGTVQIITTVTANSIYNLSWSPATTLSCNDCPDPVANPGQTTTYTLSYLYGNQCPDQRSITIERINTTVILPEIFSPNGDNNNDRFYVQLPDKVNGIVTSMSIYDRWGNLVFIKKNAPANSPADGWNGEFGSGEAMQGVYVYLIYVKIEGKAAEDVYAGDVTLIR